MQFRNDSTLVTGKVGCLVSRVTLLVCFMVGSFLTVDMAGLVNNIRVTSGFGLQVILVGSLGVSGPCTFQLSFRT